jgi:hypothetical protein
MKPVRVRRIGFILFGVLIVLAITALTSGSLVPQNQLVSEPNYKFSLTRPPFMQSARADVPKEIAAMLDQEAGIAAWMFAGSPINMTNVANAFRVIEDQTSNYIIGSVQLPGYNEHFDVHVYVHKDGWILAYYLRQDPVAKIVSIKDSNITSTNLASIIAIVAGYGGVSSSDINYYDFRYPNAKSILMVLENSDGGNYFSINMPSSFTYHERSVAGWAGIALNGTYIATNRVDYYWGYLTLSAAQMPQGVTHTISVDQVAVLVIVYSEP